jgi:hypothetical protein
MIRRFTPLFLAAFSIWFAPSILAQAPTPSVFVAGPVSSSTLAVPSVVPLPAFNETILQQIRTMPSAGGYSASHLATQRLGGSVLLTPLGLDITAAQAQPSYCSGATYLVFLKALGALQRGGQLPLDPPTLNALMVAGQRDGEGIWGRWNANGPGTARLFHELNLGPNFSDYAQARPGDFMKIFWTNAVGRKERGHSVVFLGTENVKGVDSVRFWSSNIGVGYGEKTVARSKIIFPIFSRLTAPRNLTRAASLVPVTDAYLAGLLTKDSSFAEVRNLCGMQ